MKKAREKEEAKKAEEHVKRIEADKDLLLNLGLHQFTGSLWNKFTKAMAEYGCAVVTAWLHKGEIGVRCRKG